MKVIQERAQWRDVENRETLPIPCNHLGQQREHCRLSLSTSRRCQQQTVVSGTHWLDRRLLEWSQIRPPQRVDHVVQDAWMQCVTAHDPGPASIAR